ncbi:hypothetical protein A7982_12468 [Minicystis rosea]|nr:hypothetical protein A7982_12468 [Minicystis rosea]
MRLDSSSVARLVAVVLVAVAGGCGSESGACPDDLPASCPSDAPGYAATIAPLIEARCVTCHTTGGQASDKAFGTHAEVHAQRTGILSQVYGCRMPPAGAVQLTEDERSALLAWLVCGAQDN